MNYGTSLHCVWHPALECENQMIWEGKNSAACEPGPLESVLLLRGAAVGHAFVSVAVWGKPSRARSSITHGNHA